jgi:hypothetical protein
MSFLPHQVGVPFLVHPVFKLGLVFFHACNAIHCDIKYPDDFWTHASQSVKYTGICWGSCEHVGLDSLGLGEAYDLVFLTCSQGDA